MGDIISMEMLCGVYESAYGRLKQLYCWVVKIVFNKMSDMQTQHTGKCFI